MYLERTFHSIGQGAFYTEQFFDGNDNTKPLSLVFDCGTLTSPQNDLLEESISLSRLHDSIDALFISHLHSDHINGLNALIRMHKIKNLFLPELTDEDKVKALFFNAIFNNNNSFCQSLIMAKKAGDIEGFDGNLCFVEPSPLISNTSEKSELEQGNESQESEYLTLENIAPAEEKTKSLPPNIVIKSTKASRWIFVPFNLSGNINEGLSNEINNLDNSLFVNGKIAIERFNLLWKERRSEIRAIYKKFIKDFNSNSMLLYSGPEDSVSTSFVACKCNQSCYCRQCFRIFECYLHPGCIYFGDYNLKNRVFWDNMEAKYKNYWNNVGTVQVPHHGSRSNYNKKLSTKRTIRNYVISSGLFNTFGHPHKSVYENIIKNEKSPMIVTENRCSQLSHTIYL